MKILDRILHRNVGMSPLQQQIVSNVMTGEGSRPLSDIEMQQMLGINIHLIEDERLTRILEGMAVYTVQNKDKEGNITESTEVDLAALVLRMLQSKLFHTAYTTPIGAEIGIIRSRCILRRIKMRMSDEEYEAGGSLLVDACQQHNTIAWYDSIQGKKAMLMKITPRAVEVTVSERKMKKEGMMPA